MNQCINLSQNFENFEIITFENNRAKENSQCFLDYNSKKLSIIKMKLNSELQYCKFCNQLHLNNDNQVSYAANTNSNIQIAQIIDIHTANNLLLASLFNNGFKHHEYFHKIKLGKIELKKKIESAQTALKYFNDCIHNGDKIIKKYCNNLRKQIEYQHNQKIDQLADYRKQVLKDLIEYEQRCIRSVDFYGNEWTNFKLFYLNAFNFINLFDINSILDQELDDDVNAIIDSQEAALSEKKKQLDSHLLMNKKIEFVPTFSDRIINETFNQIGTLNLTEICKNDNPIEIEQYIRLNDVLFSKQSINKWNSMNIQEILNEKCEKSFITINTVDLNVLICNRYSQIDKPQDVNSDLILIDYFNNVIKKINFTKSMIRCITSNSKYILITVETEDNIKQGDMFSLNLYDSNLNLVESISIYSTSPQALFMDEEKCYLFTNSSYVISVLDFNLNLLKQFDQNKINKEGYYSKIKPDYFMIKNSKCFMSEKDTLTKKTTFSIVDLNTGGLKQFNLDYEFNKFYLFSNDSLVFLGENAKFICYDLKNEKVKYKIDLLNETTMFSYDINKYGFIVCLSTDNSVVVY